MDVQPCRGLVINAPWFFADPAFQQWLTSGTPKFTWWTSGPVDEWSDVIVLVDPNLSGEGADSDMPEAIWNQIVHICREHLGAHGAATPHYVVRLTNLAE
ncbi:hypothetical protein Sj15T_09610 [Sphingobium sp. TA15]|uniref:Uncharacterized protein n=1 Tax=Sphingobium indicum (strain DSM 16413 / CCM 7287 / MTCC 6362 / UT26 / NBRC 101211 / UT26S) TaxID=452662 RepID=D4Z222_SPHIU|nr:hypothetical protein [Sphingobium indicum]BAI96654.1 hypothetical protein SJA_C1-18200 [Sphingobium indicum UT26S]BDD65940.1 hypothetical protein Sj15T_09610 [Sphingobium sp. TA15]